MASITLTPHRNFNPASLRAGKTPSPSAWLNSALYMPQAQFLSHSTYHLKNEGHSSTNPHCFIESELQVLGRNTQKERYGIPPNSALHNTYLFPQRPRRE